MRLQVSFASAALALGLVAWVSAASAGNLSDPAALSAEAPEMETLFIEVLNELLSVQDRDALALKRLKTVSIDKTPAGYVFKGIAYGERFRPG